MLNWKRLLADRPEVTALDTHQALEIIRAHLPSHFCSVDVERNRWGDRQRENINLGPHGTLCFMTPAFKHEVCIVPIPQLPCQTNIRASDVLTAWDEQAQRWKAEHQPVRGWRNLFITLLEGRWILPSERLSQLLERDTFKMARKATCPTWVRWETPNA